MLEKQLPVVFLKLNACVATAGVDALINTINSQLIMEAKRNGVVEDIQPAEHNVGWTLLEVIQAIRAKRNNNRVIFLVDEYDAPVTQVCG